MCLKSRFWIQNSSIIIIIIIIIYLFFIFFLGGGVAPANVKRQHT